MSDTLTSHQLVLEQLQLAADKITATSVKLEQQSELVSNHNSDEGAHLYIQQMIQNITAVSPTNLSTAISNHNVSVSAHADIRAAIETLSAEVSDAGIEAHISTHSESTEAHADIRQLIQDRSSAVTSSAMASLSNHNNSSSAHTDIRSHIDSLGMEFQLVRNNASNIASLNELFSIVDVNGPSVSDLFSSLEDRLDNTDIQVLINKDDIENCELLISQHDTALLQHDTTLSDLNNRLVVNEIEIASLKANSGIGDGGDIDLSEMICTVPQLVGVNKTYTFKITNVAVASGETLVFDLDPHLSGFTFSKTTGITLNENVQVTVPAGATAGAIKQFIVIAKYTVSGLLAQKFIVCKINTLPVTSNIVMNGIPAVVKPSGTYPVTLSGATDVDGQTLTYSITSSDPKVTFSKTANIVAGESFNVIVTGATRGAAPTFTVTVSDGIATATKVLTPTKVNNLPVVTNVVINGLPAKPVGGVPYTINFTGATDADGQALTYEIQSGYTGLTFSKTTGIAAGENITVTATKVAALTNRTVNVKAKDTLGELSVDKALIVAVNPIVKTSAPTITYPTNGAEIPAVGAGESYSITLSAYATYVEV